MCCSWIGRCGRGRGVSCRLIFVYVYMDHLVGEIWIFTTFMVPLFLTRVMVACLHGSFAWLKCM